MDSIDRDYEPRQAVLGLVREDALGQLHRLGVAAVARINLQEIKAGQLTLRGVGALVGQRPMAVSLLGMNFLRRLDGYEVRNGRLVLRW